MHGHSHIVSIDSSYSAMCTLLLYHVVQSWININMRDHCTASVPFLLFGADVRNNVNCDTERVVALPNRPEAFGNCCSPPFHYAREPTSGGAALIALIVNVKKIVSDSSYASPPFSCLVTLVLVTTFEPRTGCPS